MYRQSWWVFYGIACGREEKSIMKEDLHFFA
jgi:hypothetical protein